MSDEKTEIEISFDFDDLTLNDLEEIEEVVGVPAGAIFNRGALSAKTLKAIAYVVARKTNPELTLEQVGSVKLGAFAGEETADPTKPAA